MKPFRVFTESAAPSAGRVQNVSGCDCGLRPKSNSSAPVVRRIARSMLGRDVSVRTASGETIHGIVTSILADGDQPRVVVGTEEFALDQILTVSPAELVD